jgi:CPA2 family monovalent cation:H+ antiporter-2
VVKTVLNIALFRLLGQAWPRAFLAGVLLGQIGEFSFLLAALGGSAGIVPPDQAPLLVAVVALSLLISPLWLATARRLHHATAQSGATLSLMLEYLYLGKWRERAVQVGPYARAAVNGAGNIARKTRARLSRRRKAGANDNAGSPGTSGADKAAAETAPQDTAVAETTSAEVSASGTPATAAEVEALPPDAAPEGGGNRNRA